VTLPVDDSRARKHFHVALGGIFLLCFCPVLSWTMALLHWNDGPSPWRKRLFALAVIDVVVVVALVVFAVRSPGVTASPSSQGPRMGVGLNPAALKEAEIVSVGAGSPAERAGLRVGDRVLSVDGERVEGSERLTQVISGTKVGASRHLRVVRGGAELDIIVTPEGGGQVSPGRPRRLFESQAGAAESARIGLQEMAPGLAELAGLVVVLALAWRRRAASLMPVLALMGIVTASDTSMFLALRAFRSLAGWSLGAYLTSYLVATGTALGLALLLRRRARTHFADVERVDAVAPPATTLATVIGGMFYGLTGAMRAGLLLAALWPSLASQQGPASDSLGPSLSWGPMGIGLAVLIFVVVGPIGEEVMFRGILLPWMRTWASPMGAVVLSALVFAAAHLHYGVGIAIVFFYALVLGWARLRTGNLRACIALHMLINTTASLVSLLRP
jgi:uncharacterized protein